jgi:hypothetical protein
VQSLQGMYLWFFDGLAINAPLKVASQGCNSSCSSCPLSGQLYVFCITPHSFQDLLRYNSVHSWLFRCCINNGNSISPQIFAQVAHLYLQALSSFHYILLHSLQYHFGDMQTTRCPIFLLHAKRNDNYEA